MIKLSSIILEDALRHSNVRFKNIRNLLFNEIVNIDKHSIEAAVTHEGRRKIVKVMVDSESERAVDVIQTAKCLQRMDLPYAARTTYYPQELRIITTDNQAYLTDVILIEDSGREMFDYPAEYDGPQVIDSFVKLSSEILRHGYLFDQLHPRAFRLNEKDEVILSLSKSFLFDGVVNTNADRARAFRNYLTMTLLQLILETHNANSCNCGEQIDYPEHAERFDTRLLSQFLGGIYCEDLLLLITLVEEECDFDCTELRESLGSTKLQSMLRAFRSVSSEPTDENFPDIVGNHSEDRISVRDRKSGLMGYMDFRYQLVIDYLYEDCADFVEGLAVCILDGKYGVIDKFGVAVVPFEYSYLEWNSLGNIFYWRKGNSAIRETLRSEFLNR